jgi:glycosyltransferase involved in cell wall biosynthesis
MSYRFIFDVAEFGGHEVVTLTIAFTLALRHEVELIVPYYNQPLIAAARERTREGAGVKLTILGDPDRRAGRLHYVAELVKHLRSSPRYRVDVIPQGWPTGAFGAVLACMLVGVRKPVSYVPMWVEPSGGLLWRLARKSMFALCARSFSKVVTISASLACELGQFYRGQQVAFLDNRVPMPALAPYRKARAREALGLDQGAPAVAIIGRIDLKQKGQLRVLHAVEQCADPLGVRFVFMGSGPDKEALDAAIARSPKNDAFASLPWRGDVASLLHGFDAVLMPSYFEGVPLVMLEALLRGVPFLAASELRHCVEGLPERFFIDVDDPQAFAGSLAAAMRSPDTYKVDSTRWGEMLARFCPDDETYLRRCEECFDF